MQVYGVGEKIREERKRQQISGEELCSGICSVTTLSRIENNAQKPTLKVEEALLQRLGCDTDGLIYYADKLEMNKHVLEMELSERAMHRQPSKEKLEEYRQYIKDRNVDSSLEKQFAMMIEAVYASCTNEWEPSRVYVQLEEALYMTVPHYREDGIEKIRLLTLAETTILNNIAIILYKQGNTIRAIRIMSYLVDYAEKGNLSTENRGRKYPMLVFNLVRMLEKTGSYKEILDLCDRGIAFDKKYERMACLPGFYYYKAVALHKLAKMEEAAECFEYAICLCKITGKTILVKQLEEEQDAVLKCIREQSQNQHNIMQPLEPQ